MANKHPLAKYREDRKLTQEALATELGVTATTVWRWEHGRRYPRREEAKRISRHTGIPVIEILQIAEAS